MALGEVRSDQVYRRDRVTLVAFAGLFAFGILNALLGPVLPFLRNAEHLSYIEAALHQAAFALGGMTAGMLASRSTAPRQPMIAGGLVLSAAGGLLLGYGGVLPLTVVAAFLVSGFATTALIRMWALVSDLHAAHRAVAMTEGEVAVSLAGILTPLVVSACAATRVGWRFSFVIAVAVTTVPDAEPPTPAAAAAGDGGHSAVRTLAAIFAVVALEFALSFWAATYLHDDVGLGRDTAVALVSALYAANLVGRLVASRLARRVSTPALFRLSLLTALAGTPVLLGAGNAIVAALGLFITGAGIGGTFPLASALHVGASERSADQALGQIIFVAGFGVIVGPLVAGLVAEEANLRAGLLVLPALCLIAAATTRAPRRRPRGSAETRARSGISDR